MNYSISDHELALQNKSDYDYVIGQDEQLLTEQGPIYDPPYATPLEDELAWYLTKYLKRQVQLEYDSGYFVLTHGDAVLKIVVLLHPTDQVPDDATHSYTEEELFDDMEGTLYALSQQHPELFTPRAHYNLKRLVKATT